MDIKELAKCVINIASAIYKNMGCGIFQEVYEKCLIYELEARNIKVERQKLMPLKYKRLKFGNAYKVDIIVENILVIGIQPVHIPKEIFYKQIETYARHSECSIGLILDFNATDFLSGVTIVQKPAVNPISFPAEFMKYYYNRNK